MKDTLSVLGGGSPFTIALIDALAGAADRLPISRLSLCGRSPDPLRHVATYARHQLERFGWTVSHTTSLEESLAGSAFVVQQIRFGGLDGRAADEAVAEQCGLAADETLGPAALHCVLRTASSLEALGRAIARAAPDAWVLNLSNPLGIATALLARGGVSRGIGVCELPMTTAADVAALLGRDISELSWDYAGLNHRGFLVDFKLDGKDAWPAVAERARGGAFAGIRDPLLDRLRAVPTKYFRLVVDPSGPPHGSRAAVLSGLRQRAIDELYRAPNQRPPSLAERRMDWYDAALIPLLRALCDPAGARLIVNQVGDTGLVEERLARVSSAGVCVDPAPAVGPDVARWLDVFRAHERALLAVALEPTPSRIAEAVCADPAIPPVKRKQVVELTQPRL